MKIAAIITRTLSSAVLNWTLLDVSLTTFIFNLEKVKDGLKMTIKEIPILITGATFTLIGCALIGWWSAKSGYFNFMRSFHYYALIFFILAGIATWLALILPVNPERFEVTNKQYVALGMSILISILWWLRYVLSISPATEVLEEEDE